MLEENPGLIIGAVVVLFLVLAMRGGGSGGVSADTMVSAQLKAQETAAKTDVALAGINADQAKARTLAMADVYKTSVTSKAQLAGTRDTNAAKVTLGMAGYQTQQQQIAAQERVSTRAIVANQETAAMSLGVQSQALTDASNLKHYQLEMTSANLPLILKSQETVAGITSQQMQAIAALQTEASRTTASAGAQTASTNNGLGIIGTVANIASMFF